MKGKYDLFINRFNCRATDWIVVNFYFLVSITKCREIKWRSVSSRIVLKKLFWLLVKFSSFTFLSDWKQLTLKELLRIEREIEVFYYSLLGESK